MDGGSPTVPWVLADRPTSIHARARGVMAALLAVTLAAAALVAAPSSARAATGDLGTRGASVAGFANTIPTAAKPQSKLWFAAGWWWASMASATTGGYRINRLDRASGTWVDTGVDLDPRGATRADVLWNGSHLFVASHAVASSSTATSTAQPARLFRYSWDGATWTPDEGFPVTITPSSAESLTIAQTSAGRMWATWTQGRRLFLAQTTGSADAGAVSFGAPFIPTMANLTATESASATTLHGDDISTVVSADGVTTLLWSNQVTGTTWSARRDDAAATWTATPVISGPLLSDDHLNLRAIPGDPARRVVAVVKTSLNDSPLPLPDGPLLVAAVYTPADGAWTTSTIATVAEAATRPIVEIGPGSDELRVFYSAPSTAGGAGFEGTIYEKDSTISGLVFPAAGTPVLRDVTNATMNNVTSTRQTATSTSGVVILAATEVSARYWHRVFGGSSAAPALAAFTSATVLGGSTRQLAFTDRSAGSPTSWRWDFGDGTTSTQRNPTHTYARAGTVVVRLTVDNANGPASTVTRSIAVGVPPVASFTMTQPSRSVLALELTDTSTGEPDSITWDFGDGTTLEGAAPGGAVVHEYAVAGTYRVTLTASNGAGTDVVDHPSTAAGPYDAVVTATPVRIARPTRSVPSGRKVLLTWMVPDPRGLPINTYQVVCRAPGSTRTAYVAVSDPTLGFGQPRTRTVGSLVAGARYSCVVRAHNGAGWSVASPASAAFTARA
ncbi:PKD domain-containing protein [Longivirga aurantiaca]|uniref:PKD domain-containing protein n=1 Tax=Longivirga aurantiaca TaxID=1837743 RepID=A0ABW1T2N1_9ACTN